MYRGRVNWYLSWLVMEINTCFGRKLSVATAHVVRGWKFVSSTTFKLESETSLRSKRSSTRQTKFGPHDGVFSHSGHANNVCLQCEKLLCKARISFRVIRERLLRRLIRNCLFFFFNEIYHKQTSFSKHLNESLDVVLHFTTAAHNSWCEKFIIQLLVLYVVFFFFALNF